ncbi:hypothetical protein THAOC_13872, partial [Thalassiosira oceanica]
MSPSRLAMDSSAAGSHDRADGGRSSSRMDRDWASAVGSTGSLISSCTSDGTAGRGGVPVLRRAPSGPAGEHVIGVRRATALVSDWFRRWRASRGSLGLPTCPRTRPRHDVAARRPSRPCGTPRPSHVASPAPPRRVGRFRRPSVPSVDFRRADGPLRDTPAAPRPGRAGGCRAGPGSSGGRAVPRPATGAAG